MRVLCALSLVLGLGCASGQVKVDTETALANSKAGARASSAIRDPDTKGTGGARCNAGMAAREVSEYDTSGDEVPDVRKVFQRIGSAEESRLVMICRESDLNSDGRKDVIRYYDDEGRSLREEADRNFDGRMDIVVVFQNGKVVRKEFDDNQDGKIESKVFFENEVPLRAERDLAGRSTETEWKPNRWEYYEDGQMVRMGTDVDGDARVDRWDRNADFHAKKKQEEAAAEAEAAKAANDDGGG